MKIALIGDDPALLPLLKWLAGREDCALMHAALAGEILPDVVQTAPGVRVSDNWDELVVSPPDAALIAGWSEPVLLAAKQLASAGVPLIVWPEVRQGLQWIYELTLIRDDSHVPLVPIFPQRLSAAVRRAREVLDRGELGDVLHLKFERELPAVQGTPLLNREEIERHLLHDVDLLRFLGGDYDQVTALESAADVGRVSQAAVTLAGKGLPESLWSARPADGSASFNLHAVCKNGVARIIQAGSVEPRLEVDGRPIVLSGDESPVGQGMWRQVEAGLRGDHVAYPEWADAIRAFEVVDTARRSIRRRRTIDLHFETTSERGQFKTQMTAIGCAVLVATFLAVLILLMLGAVFELNESVMRVARIAVFVPLFLYLILQGLLFLARPSSAARQGLESDNRDADG